MKYFGEKSLSSVLHKVLQASWILAIACAILLSVFLCLALLPIPWQGNTTTALALSMSCGAQHPDPEWTSFLQLPWYAKTLVFPYLGLVTWLGVQVLRRARDLFARFRHDEVFSQENVGILSGLNRFLIAFSIVTMNLSTLLVCLILVLVCEVLKNGTTLREELELTV